MIILINGTSSSGKSTIASLLQQSLGDGWLYFSMDGYLSMLGPKFLGLHPDNPKLDEPNEVSFAKKHPDNSYEIVLGSLCLKLNKTLPDVLDLIAKQGLHIIVDAFITSKEELEHYQKTLAQYGLLSVYLYAPNNIIIDREKQRGDRLQGSALHWLKKFDFKEDDYHLAFNTHLTSIEQIREDILKRITFNQNSEAIKIRPFAQADIELLFNSFANHPWFKPKETFESYWFEQCNEERLIWLATHDNQLAGYVTLKWVSNYQPFKEAQIPEIMDLNVLSTYRNKGIGSRLLATAEKEAGSKSSVVGLGVGLIEEACHFARHKGASTMTVETLSPFESDENYLKTYHFYQSVGFAPLINLKPQDYIWNMVYMVKVLNENS